MPHSQGIGDIFEIVDVVYQLFKVVMFGLEPHGPVSY